LGLSACDTGDGASHSERDTERAETDTAQALSDAGITARAELLLTNGKIFTADDNNSFAAAVAVVDGIIAYVGEAQGAIDYIGPETRIVDLGGRLALPGLHDVHQHTLEAHLELIDCILDGNALDPEEYIYDLEICTISSETGWVLGAGYSILTLLLAERPAREILDDLFPDTPVAIMEETSHSTWVNTAALELLKIDQNSADPPGGLILKDDSGHPNGILIDAAGEWPWNSALQPNPALLAKNYAALRDGMAHNSENGITSAVDARVYWERGYLEAYRQAEAEDTLSLRMILSLWAYPDKSDNEQLAKLKDLYRDEGGMLRLSQIKLYSDGLIQNKTAALLEPYLVESWGSPLGLNYFDEPRLTVYTTALQQLGFDMHIHAIGDRGVHEALNAIEASQEQPGGDGGRHRLTHIELVHPNDVPRFNALGVYADMQLTEWNQPEQLHELDEFIGFDRTDERAWPLRDLHDSHLKIALSSDYDVGALNPFEGIERALTRGEQSLPSVTAAVRAYTINAAWLMRSENQTGSIEPGKRADIVIIDQDIFEIEPSLISSTRVLWTLLDGEEMFRAESFDF